MEASVVLDRSPVSGLRRRDNLPRLFYFVRGWCHAANDVRDLIGVNTPHS